MRGAARQNAAVSPNRERVLRRDITSGFIVSLISILPDLVSSFSPHRLRCHHGTDSRLSGVDVLPLDFELTFDNLKTDSPCRSRSTAGVRSIHQHAGAAARSRCTYSRSPYYTTARRVVRRATPQRSPGLPVVLPWLVRFQWTAKDRHSLPTVPAHMRGPQQPRSLLGCKTRHTRFILPLLIYINHPGAFSERRDASVHPPSRRKQAA